MDNLPFIEAGLTFGLVEQGKEKKNENQQSDINY
jgi:hypothetical protein